MKWFLPFLLCMTCYGVSQELGTPPFIFSTDSSLCVYDHSDGLSIAKGDVTGLSFIHKFGNAPDFDASDGQITVWDGANDGDINQMDYVYSTTNLIDSISSSSAADLQEIKIFGVDSNYIDVTQFATLNGQTRVALTNDLLRVYRCINVGSSNLAGFFYCYENIALSSGVPSDSTKVRATINNGNNQTLMANYSVPTNKTAYVRDWFASTAGANKSSNYIVEFYARPFGQVFQLKHKWSLADDGTSLFKYDFIEPQPFEARTDIEVRVTMTAAGGIAGSVSAGFDVVLVDD